MESVLGVIETPSGLVVLGPSSSAFVAPASTLAPSRSPSGAVKPAASATSTVGVATSQPGSTPGPTDPPTFGPPPPDAPGPTLEPTPFPTVAEPTPFPTLLPGTPFPTFQPTLAPTPTPAPTPSPSPSPLPTPTPTGKTVTIAAAGDIACDPASNVGAPQDCDQAATADLIGSLRPTAVLPLGDNQYEDGTLAAFQAVYAPTWGKYFSITHPAVGNHEYLTPGASGYFGYFGVPAYYSYNLGSWHFISLDSECNQVGGCQAGSAEEAWLQADLRANSKLCTLAYWHEPIWSSGQEPQATQMLAIWADLETANVDVVLTGHNHDYERFVPLDASGQPNPAGVTEFVVGTGGKNHTGFPVPPLTGAQPWLSIHGAERTALEKGAAVQGSG